ncbi:hypothetical protein [Actinoplanes sp. NPDC051494]|uniref:hypothetical protein n=1 Tax=Actinoplanes sp. NPDC051494 TaxID=3363907 RepID=UPI0037AB986D
MIAVALAVLGSILALPGRAAAVEPGFDVTITELPATFGAGAESRSLTVVASTDKRRCIKVRWSLLIRVDGPDLDEVKVTRVENDGEFAARRQDADNTARITDERVDPGQLCRGSTVTASYRVSFDEDADTGRILFQAQAFTAGGTLLQEATGQSPVVGQEPAATESPQESASPSPSPSPEESDGVEDADDAAETPDDDAPTSSSPGIIDAAPASAQGGGPSLLGPGLIVGALLVFIGVALLLRLRTRQRTAAAEAAELPTGFYRTR